MATRELKHRTGHIQYEYNDTIPWTEVDQEMADGLAHCLLANEKSIEEAKALLNRSCALSEQIKILTTEHEQVGTLLRTAQDLAGGYVGALELGQHALVDMLSNATNETSDAVQQQNRKVSDLHSDYSQLIRDHDAIVEQDERDNEEVYSKLTDLFSIGYEAKDLATDLMSFHDATERTRDFLYYHQHQRENNLNHVLDAIRDYEFLQVQVEGQQRVWEEYCSRLILIEYIGKLHSGQQPMSFN